MLKYLIVVYYTVCSGTVLFSQSNHTLIGSRAQGLGYATSAMYDEWSLFNNVAGLARIDHLSAGFTYEVHPQLKSFNRMAATCTMPLRTGAVGGSVFRFGDDLYNEQMLSLGYANEFGLASLGLKVSYIQYHAEGFETKGFFSFGFGGIANLTPTFSLAAHITNIAQGKINEDPEERIPTILTAGFSYRPTTRVLITSELEKDLDYRVKWKSGIEYTPFKKFSFRTGFNAERYALFMGTGFKVTKFTFDYAFQYQSYMGTVHQASVTYHVNEKKK